MLDRSSLKLQGLKFMLDLVHTNKPTEFKVQHLCKALRLGTCFVKKDDVFLLHCKELESLLLLSCLILSEIQVAARDLRMCPVSRTS